MSRLFDSEHVKQVFKSRLFWGGLFFKIALGSVLASSFLDSLFLPFVKYFAAHPSLDPYQHFVEAGIPQAFPYPALMLYLLSVGSGFLHALGIENSIADFLFMRLPLLVADIVVLLVLVLWLKSSVKRVLIFYWLSPILLYISYVHGQLDVIPIAFLMVSLFFLFKEKTTHSALALGLGICTKTHLLLAVPFFLVFFFLKKVPLRTLVGATGCLVVPFLIINAPFLFSSSFYSMVLQNAEQAKVFHLYFSFAEGINFYLLPAAYFALLIAAVRLRTFSKDVFIMFLGFAFGVTLLFIPPRQGWYFWVVPFFVYFHSKNKEASVAPILTLQLLYFMHFFFIKESDFFLVFKNLSGDIASFPAPYAWLKVWGYDSDLVSGTMFSLLQVGLLGNCLWVYRYGIKSFASHKLTAKPFLIGISGDSGVGKTTLAQSIAKIFGEANTTILSGDDMHKWERGHKKWSEVTHLNPKANELHQEYQFLRALKNGKRIWRRHYDHESGKFTEPKCIHPQRIVVLEGLHSLYLARSRELFDLRIMLKPEQNLASHWKILRDTTVRRYSKKRVLEQIHARREDSFKYVAAQEEHADVLVEIIPNGPLENPGQKDLPVHITYRFQFENIINFDGLIEWFEQCSQLFVEHQFIQNDRQILVVRTEADSALMGTLASKLNPDLIDLGFENPEWSSGEQGVLQLVLTYYILEKLRLDNGF